MDEPLATEYVRTHTSIPVPKVLDVVPTGNKRHPWLMISAPLPGHRLRWASGCQLQRVTDDLSNWLEQLRALPSPHSERVCGFAGGPLRSFRIAQEPVGPFETVADFHSQPFCTVHRNDYDKLISARPHKHYSIRLVHGDLLLHNILADENLRLTGLVDWECAAWMPEYWENVLSSHGHYLWMWCWKDICHDAFPQYEDDLVIDRLIQKDWCD
ncbi:kinase-like domain-containing protein [Mycena haematopus]|nr:kinase-like domain-containing protein [Mycena haematopus]